MDIFLFILHPEADLARIRTCAPGAVAIGLPMKAGARASSSSS
ncbi:hypothetical protein [Pandoraea sp. PE-S2R-1]|nr:hypothetical protein [Pandoraea sp. PE-S2R-1]